MLQESDSDGLWTSALKDTKFLRLEGMVLILVFHTVKFYFEVLTYNLLTHGMIFTSFFSFLFEHGHLYALLLLI